MCAVPMLVIIAKSGSAATDSRSTSPNALMPISSTAHAVSAGISLTDSGIPIRLLWFPGVR